MKTCSKCKLSKPLSDFSRDRRSSDGVQYHCKKCNATYYRDNLSTRTNYRRANLESLYKVRRAKREKLKSRTREECDSDFERLRGSKKRCRVCKTSAPMNDFHMHRINEDGRRAECKSCTAIIWLERHHPRLPEYWIEHGVDPRKCVYCLRDNPTDRDHFYPVARGGGDEFENLFPACRGCNRGVGGKFDKEPWEWVANNFPGRLSWFRDRVPPPIDTC